MKAYRARILNFDPHAAPSESARLDDDGLLVIGPNAQGKQVVQMVGDYALLIDGFKAQHPQLAGQSLEYERGKLSWHPVFKLNVCGKQSSQKMTL